MMQLAYTGLNREGLAGVLAVRITTLTLEGLVVPAHQTVQARVANYTIIAPTQEVVPLGFAEPDKVVKGVPLYTWILAHPFQEIIERTWLLSGAPQASTLAPDKRSFRSRRLRLIMIQYHWTELMQLLHQVFQVDQESIKFHRKVNIPEL